MRLAGAGESKQDIVLVPLAKRYSLPLPDGLGALIDSMREFLGDRCCRCRREYEHHKGFPWQSEVEGEV